jgi:hypothetical protein
MWYDAPATPQDFSPDLSRIQRGEKNISGTRRYHSVPSGTPAPIFAVATDSTPSVTFPFIQLSKIKKY